MSGVEPGPNGTMILTAFVGHSWAAATAGANNSANNAKATLLFIELFRSASCHLRAAYLCVRVGAAIITGDAPSQAWSSRNRSGGCNGETQGSLASRLAMPSTASLASALRRYGFVRGSAGGPMGLTILVLGLALFFAAHVFVTLRTPRAAVIKRIGEWPYKGLMSLVSLAGLIVIRDGFGDCRARRV